MENNSAFKSTSKSKEEKMKTDILQKADPYYLQIQQTIKNRIWNGFYKPGDRLFEVQLAKQFEISRSPVREAIRSLVNEGLLIMDSKSQITVYEPSAQDVWEIYECRSALESTAVALAAKRAEIKHLDELEQILNETHIAIQNEDEKKIVDCNAKFHELIINTSGNFRLKKIVEDLHSLTYYYRALNVRGDNRASKILKEHKEIFEAIKEKDPEKAKRKLKEHTSNDMENLLRIIK